MSTCQAPFRTHLAVERWTAVAPRIQNQDTFRAWGVHPELGASQGTEIRQTVAVDVHVEKEEGNLDHKARTCHMEMDMKMGRLGVVVVVGGVVHEGRHAPLVRRLFLFLFLLFLCRLLREEGSPPDREEVDKGHKERSRGTVYILRKVKENKGSLVEVVVEGIHEEEIRWGGILVEGIHVQAVHVQAAQDHQDLFFSHLLLLLDLDLDLTLRTFYQEKGQLMNCYLLLCASEE